MARDALDPGPDNSYPYWPRNPDGSPKMDATGAQDGGMPVGLRTIRLGKTKRVLIDVTPRDDAGAPIVPPTVPDA